ncbi:MAG: hypothetical protein AAGA42_10765 [Actinomycetota bacterium]
MNRTGRATLALTVGFAAAGAAILAGATDVDDNAATAEVFGGVDVFAYCQQQFGQQSQAMLVGTNAFSWRCTNQSNGIFQLEDVDLNAACAAQYGDDASSETDAPDDPYSWVCVS